MHLSSMRVYKMLEYDIEKLDVIYSGTGYDTLLNNGAMLYYRTGTSPEHVSYGYKKDYND